MGRTGDRLHVVVDDVEDLNDHDVERSSYLESWPVPSETSHAEPTVFGSFAGLQSRGAWVSMMAVCSCVLAHAWLLCCLRG
jgi:hypothetical protein